MARRAKQNIRVETTYGPLRHPYAPQALFSEDYINQIHSEALRVLETLGLKILNAEARTILSQNGAIERDEMVYIGRDMVEEALRTAPNHFTLKAADPVHDYVMNRDTLLFAAGGGSPNATDRVKGRRAGDRETFENCLKLQQSFDVIHKLSPSCEPQDIAPNLRHYAMTEAQLRLCGKPMFAYARGRAQSMDIFDMVRIANGLTDEEFIADPWVTTVINTNSPRLIDHPMAEGLIDFARAGQLCVITPFCLSGAMAPVTVAGALLLQHTEVLGALTLHQLANPGAPVQYGAFGSNVDMKSGAPAFGTPTQIQLTIGSGQLARHAGLLWRSAAGTASNTHDMQASGETHMALWGTLMGNANSVYHAAGWLEGGLTFGFEKFINDIEALRSIAHLTRPLSETTQEMGFAALEEVAPGGHFFAAKHTMERYETAFYAPINADLRSFGTWEGAGAVPAEDRATRLWQGIVEAYQTPASGLERAATLEPFITKRTAEGGAALSA